MPPLQWRPGDFYGSVESLIETSVAALKSAYPEIDRARFDLSTGQFVSGRGVPLREPDWERIVEDFPGRARRAGAGRRTLQRGILLNTLLRASRGERSGLLEQVSRLAHQHFSGSPVERIFYLRNPGRRPGVHPGLDPGLKPGFRILFCPAA
ncbi:MAG: hypothetical protein AB7O70_07970 [Hyphomicrobiales bacterium]